MKSIEIVTSKVEMLVVDLPRDATTATSTDKNGNSNYFDGREWRKMYLPKGNWQNLGKATELTGEDWKGIVNFQTTFRNGNRIDYMFEDYQNSDHPFEAITFETATESGLSLLKANGIFFENGISSTYPVTFDRVTKKEWQEAESKVFRNCHVFIKQK